MEPRRRSTRLKLTADIHSKADNACAVVSDDDGSDAQSYSPIKKRNKKRARKDVDAAFETRKLRGRRGKLKELPEMPLDILFDIFGHLNPNDVLNLSRTTKALRKILMHRSAISVWKEARSNVSNLPDCPPDLTEPQYADLAFSTYCHFCYAPHVQTVFWAARVRCCQKCIPENFMEGNGLYLELGMEALPPNGTISEVLPGTRYKLGKRRWPFCIVYSLADAKKFSKDYIHVKDNKEKLAQLIIRWKKTKAERESHATLAKTWRFERTSHRSNELDEARRRRKQAIKAKLTALGWGEEVEKLESDEPRAFDNHQLVRQPKDLTERIWTNIETKMIEFLEEIKAKRLKKEHIIMVKARLLVFMQVIKDYNVTRPIDEANPCPADLYEMEQFKAIVEDTPIETTITAESFQEMVEKLPLLCHQWRVARDIDLLAIVQRSLSQRKGEDVTERQTPNVRLDQATTFFKCDVCVEPISYPRILIHRCMVGFCFSRHSGDDVRCQRFLTLSSEPWNFGGDRLDFHHDAYEVARSIVECSGRNPEITTAQELDSADLWVECMECHVNRSTAGRMVMNWRTAVTHRYHNGVGSFPCLKWRIINEVDREFARKEQTSRMQTTWGYDYVCTRCHLKTSLTSLYTHIKNAHGIEAIQKTDYSIHPDASISSSLPEVRIKMPPPSPPVLDEESCEPLLVG